MSTPIRISHKYSKHVLVTGLTLFAMVLFLAFCYFGSCIKVLVIVSGLIAYIGFLLISFNRPLFSLLIFLILIGNPLGINDRISVPFMGDSLELREIIFLTLLVVLMVKIATSRNTFRNQSPLVHLIVAFFGMTILSVLTATRNEVPVAWIIREGFPIVYILSLFLILFYIRNNKDFNFLLKGLLYVSSFLSILVIAQALVGKSIILVGVAERVHQLPTGFRIMPEGCALINSAFLISVILLLTSDTSKRLCTITAITSGVALILTFTRTFWFSNVIALLISFLILKGRVKFGRILGFFVVIFLLWNIATPFLPETGYVSKYLNQCWDRILEVSQGRQLSTVDYRLLEVEIAAEKIKANPFGGIGLGNYYAPTILSPYPEGRYPLTTKHRSIHNSYFYIALKMGIPALGIYLLLMMLFIHRGLTKYRKLRVANYTYEMGAILGILASVVAFLVSGTVSGNFLDVRHTPVIFMLVGLCEAMRELNETCP